MKKRVFSGIQPSGDLTIGNYLGALKNFSGFEEDYETFYCIVDLHAITIRQVPKDLRERTLKLLALYLASGLHPDKDTLFIQSHVSLHAELAWILGCNTYMGELSRMTQYKDKIKSLGGNIPAGLFTYPILMAADILLYNADVVPVGDDQRQHLELARTLAQRFNQAYSPTFTVPQGFYNKEGARIYDLQDPTRKMSKSNESLQGTILLEDTPEVIARKIARAQTDSLAEVNYSEEQPGVKNLLNIYCLCKECSVEEALKEFASSSYKELKDGVTTAVIETLEPFQKRFYEIYEDKEYLEKVYRQGAEKAFVVGRKTLDKVKRKIGFIGR